jgi:NAD(P)-dependent dehydrogenase (short-subunit alcohol dehydrogenase family)
MTTSAKSRTWFITGASTGFGRLLAEELLKTGNKVVATARNVAHVADLEQKYTESVKALALDVTDAAQVLSVAAAAIEHFGQIDVVVNNAGYGITGAVEEVTEEEYTPVFATNLFGLINVTKAFLPHLRERKSGHILNLSSIGGLIGLAGWGYYNATKFAVEGLSEALAVELAPLGIHVTIIEPGPFRTDFLGRSGVVAKQQIADYDQTAGKTREYRGDQSGKQKGDPLKAVHAMMQVVDAPNPPVHLLLGSMALTRFRGKLESFQQEMKDWESVSLGADFPEGA